MHPAQARHDATAKGIARGLLWAIDVYRLPDIVVKDVARGRWHDDGHITLPRWLFTEGRCDSFVRYYVAHELAHWLMDRPGHDLHFQTMLAWLAPDDWHWEASYKPKLYAQAFRALYDQNGISSSKPSASAPPGVHAGRSGAVIASSTAHTRLACQPGHFSL